jgi:UDPglucose 6-dehydrogenase
MLPKIETITGGLSGKRVAVFGLSFKPETDDMRDAPSIDIIRGLIDAGANVVAYDPVAQMEAEKHLPKIEYAEDEYAAATCGRCAGLITEWNQFRALDMQAHLPAHANA